MNELKLLKGEPVEIVNGLYSYPLLLSEIVDIGEGTYNSYVSSITLNKTSILNKLEDNIIPQKELEEIHSLNDLEFLIYISFYSPELFQNFIDALKIFLKSDVEVLKDTGIVISNDKEQFLLDNELFLKIREVVAKQNYVQYKEENRYKPANVKAKALLEKMNKIKAKIKNKNKEEGLSLKTIISIVSTYSNDVNIMSVWNLTVYQLYECYIRIIVWDTYHNQYMLLPHINDESKQEVFENHWAKDINKII